MTVRSPLARCIQWATDRPGSTRTSALLRIGLGVLLWSRWAAELLPYRDLSPDRLVIGGVFFVSTTLMVAGLWSRISTLVAGLTALTLVYYVGWVQGVESYQHHHTTFLATSAFLLAFTPCGGSYSVDRWRAVRRAERSRGAWPAERGNTWALRLVALQLASVYFWGAFEKCSMAFLSGTRLEQVFIYFYIGSDVPFPAWFGPLCVALSITTVVLEFSLAIGLWFRRLQLPLVLAGIAFHLGIYYALPVATFSLNAIVVYLAFMDPDQIHRIIDRLSGAPAPTEE